jgi:hypothetical protein
VSNRPGFTLSSQRRHNLSPDGLAAFELRGSFYLAIANEVAAPEATTTDTTLYRVDRVKR